MKGKHLNIVSFGIPYPPDQGGLIDVFYKMKAFIDEGIKVHLHCFEYNREPAKILNELCESVHYYKRNLSKLDLFAKKPFIVISRTSEELVNNLMKNNYPILFEGLHTFYYLDDKRLRDRMKIVRTHNIEHIYYKHLARVEKNVFRKYYFYNESNKLQSFQKILKKADGIAAISLNDTAYFQKRCANVKTIMAFHSNNEVTIKKGKGDYVLYHGSLNVGENNEAALYLIKNVFNDLKIPLIIAGNHPSKELKDAVKNKKYIELKNNISTEEIYKLIRNAQINILPTFQATGIKLKLLAALYQGRHCLVNSTMVKDTGLEKLCVIKDSPEEMKSSVKKLFSVPFSQEEIKQREDILLHNGFSNKQNIQELIKFLFRAV